MKPSRNTFKQNILKRRKYGSPNGRGRDSSITKPSTH